MKQITPVISLLLLVVFVLATPVSAQIGSNSPEKISELTQTPVKPGQNQTSPQSRPQTQNPNTTSQRPAVSQQAPSQNRGVNEIQRRITALNQVATQIESMQGLSEETKMALTTEIEEQITMLTQLQTQLQSADASTSTELNQSVVESYSSFAVFMPKVRTILAAEGVTAVSEKMTSIQERLASQVTDLSTQGVDTSEMEQTLIDAEESIMSAQENANQAIELVTPLTPDEYPGNKTVFQNARTLLRDARLSLVSARDSLRGLVSALNESEPSSEISGTMPSQSPSGSQSAPSDTMEMEVSN